MSRELKRMKKDLMNISKHISKSKFVVQALDGLFMIDLSKTDEGKVTPVKEVPKGMNVEVIEAKIENILICGGSGYEPIFIINDVLMDDFNTIIHNR